MNEHGPVDVAIKRLVGAAEQHDDERLRVLAAAVQDGEVRDALAERVDGNDIYEGAVIAGGEDGSHVVDFVFRRSPQSAFSLLPPSVRVVVNRDGRVNRVATPVGLEATDDMVKAAPHLSLADLFVEPRRGRGSAVATYYNGPTYYWV